jgi:AcrR family transcriptional regulator
MRVVSETERPLRADAARNRARVLEVAYETFAAEGLSVPIDEIARRAGVGAGTVYRHFPTKEALFAAVVGARVSGMVAGGWTLLDSEGPGEALFAFLRQIVTTSAIDHGLVEALAGYGIDVTAAAPGVEASFLELLGALLVAAQGAGTARRDVGVAEVKALLVVCKAAQGYGDDVTLKVTAVIEAGLRASA